MERILVAVDFSDPSRIALRSAMELARVFKAPLHVIHVIPCQIYGPGRAQMVSVLACGTAEAEKELVDLVLNEFKGTKEELAALDYKALEGNESDEILREAGNWNASLIVLGSHGRTGAGMPLLGSVSSRVVSRAATSVLVIPESTGKALPERILVALDDGDKLGSCILERSAVWARALGAELTVLHVIPDILETGSGRLSEAAQQTAEWQAILHSTEKDVRAALAAGFAGECQPKLRYRVGRPYVEICAEAREGGYDMIIVAYEHSQFALDLGNTAGRVAHTSPCPVLLLRRQARAVALDDVPNSC